MDGPRKCVVSPRPHTASPSGRKLASLDRVRPRPLSAAAGPVRDSHKRIIRRAPFENLRPTTAREPRLKKTIDAILASTSPKVTDDKKHLLCNLPSNAPTNLDHCGESCYWRWMVRALLEDVAELKRRLDEARDGLLQRSIARRQQEQRYEHRHLVKKESESLHAALDTLAREVPWLHQKRKSLQYEAEHLRDVENQLQAQKSWLDNSIQIDTETIDLLESKLKDLDKQVEEKKGEEQDMIKTIHSSKKELEDEKTKLEQLAMKREKLKAEVSNNDRKGNRSGSLKKKGKSHHKKKS